MELEGWRGEEEKREGEVMVRIYYMRKLLSIKKKEIENYFQQLK